MPKTRLYFLSLLLFLGLPSFAEPVADPAKAQSVLTLRSIPEELRELFLKSAAHARNPLPYFADPQGVLYRSGINGQSPKPVTESQLADLNRRLKGIWLALHGLPPAFAKKHPYGATPHLYDPDGHVSAMGNELYEAMSKNKDIIHLISLKELSLQTQKYSDNLYREGQNPSDPNQPNALDSFFDQARRLQSGDWLAAPPEGAVPADISQALPFRLRALEAEALKPSAREAVSRLMGGSTIPAVPPDIGELFSEARRLDASRNGADYEKALETAITALPMGSEILKTGLHQLWARGYTGKKVKIAFIEEAGFPDSSHPVLQGHVRNQYLPDQDRSVSEHATFIAGILRTLAPGADILAYSGELTQGMKQTQLDTTDWTLTKLAHSSLQRAFISEIMEDAYRKGAKVISISHVLRAAEDPGSDLIRQKIEELAKKGVLIVAGAGNQLSKDPNQSDPYNSRAQRIGSSYSSSPHAIIVGNIDSDSNIHFSSYFADIYAPGTKILSTRGTGQKFQDQISKGLRPPFEETYRPLTGTSFSAPFLAAVSACLIQAVPKAVPSRLRESLISTSIPQSRKLEAAFKSPLDSKPLRIQEELRWKIVDPVSALQALQKSQTPRIKILPPEPSKNP